MAFDPEGSRPRKEVAGSPAGGNYGAGPAGTIATISTRCGFREWLTQFSCRRGRSAKGFVDGAGVLSCCEDFNNHHIGTLQCRQEGASTPSTKSLTVEVARRMECEEHESSSDGAMLAA